MLFLSEYYANWATRFVYTISVGAGLFVGLDLVLAVPGLAHHWKHLFKYLLWPVGVQVVVAFCIPETYVYHMKNGNDKEAQKVLEMGYTPEEAKKILEELKEEQKFFFTEKITIENKYRDLCGLYGKALAIVCVMALFSQLLGVSAFVYYGPEIFLTTQSDVDAGMEREISAVWLANIIVGTLFVGSLIATFVQTLASKRILLMVTGGTAIAMFFALSYTMY